MKTQGMSQQITALEKMDGRRWYALFMEQGTGKTWSFLADAERYWLRGKVDTLFVLAPNGVHTNWVLREIPAHMDCDPLVGAWRSGAGKGFTAKLRKLLQPNRRLRIFTMNYEALRGAGAREFALEFLQSGKCMMVLDESQKIKNPSSSTTKEVMKLKMHSVARRIGSGTPMDKPQDIFSQMEFLAPGLLGTSSFRAFVSEYAVLANFQEPRTDSDWAMKRMVEKNPRLAHAQVVARDETTGLPMYRNLDKLQRLVEAVSYRVLKKDCLDLPPKVYQSTYFELTPAQTRAYELMEQQCRIELENGDVSPVSALSALIKLQQITSGYVVVPGREELLYIGDDNPRVQAVVDAVEDVTGKVIVWARFREEVRALAEALTKAGRVVVQYHGDVKPADRELAIDRLQHGDADVFIGVQKAGGTGLTLTAAETTIYCSNEYSAIVRNQSEDRNHRKGTTGTVVYIDIVARGTIDEAITKTHQWKTDLASNILGDCKLDFRGLLAG